MLLILTSLKICCLVNGCIILRLDIARMQLDIDSVRWDIAKVVWNKQYQRQGVQRYRVRLLWDKVLHAHCWIREGYKVMMG